MFEVDILDARKLKKKSESVKKSSYRCYDEMRRLCVGDALLRAVVFKN